MKQWKTDVVIVFGLLILHEKLQTLFPDEWLNVATTSMHPFWFSSLAFRLVFRVIGFTNHSRLAEPPDDSHPLFWVAYMADFTGKVCVRLMFER